ncbi:MAG: hypothetical protein EZS28_010048 [Streblomastix strix]|uniref:Uncharacterized protein n=1 Tax=Streblomastix strix TaxID=222440 RepID=A0A5J4WH79_9EUKA|nr:MAG: hypothetical protein EZS28_010048 [Streblomastix strix]
MNTPTIKMIIKFEDMKITIALMMYLVKMFWQCYKQEIIEENERKVENEENTQSKLKIPGQRHWNTGEVNGTMNTSTQSSRIKQITGWVDYNFGSTSWHTEGETAIVFEAYRTTLADGFGFQPLIGQEQEQSEDEPEQELGQLDLNNFPDNPEIDGPPGLTQETRRSEANKGYIKPRYKSSCEKKKAG